MEFSLPKLAQYNRLKYCLKKPLNLKKTIFSKTSKNLDSAFKTDLDFYDCFGYNRIYDVTTHTSPWEMTLIW